MKNNLNEELNRLKFLLGYKPGQLMTESQVKGTYLNEVTTITTTLNGETGGKKKPKLSLWRIDPVVKGIGASEFYLAWDETNGKLYAYNYFTDKLGKQIGSTEFTGERKLLDAYDKNDPIIQNADEYVLSVNQGNRSRNYFLQRGVDKFTYAIVINNMDNQPQLVGITDKTNQIGENVILYGRTASPYNFRDVTTTTTTLPDKPKEKIYTLDLKDSFFYDCPNMIGCGKQNGSNEQPLTDEKELKRIKGMGRLLASLKDFPIIFKTNFYLIGYASSENDQKAIVQGGLTRYQHNLQLSEERAQFVADNLIESFEANGGETLNIQVEGKGPTDKFAKGNDNESLKQNRRVMLTNNPNSLTPIKIKVTYDDRWNPINVELIQ